MEEIVKLVEDLFGLVQSHGMPEILGAFVLGAAASILNARATIAGAAVLLWVLVGQAYTGPDLSAAQLEAIWWVGLCLVVLGLLQASVTMLAGRDAAGTAIWAVPLAILLAILWKAPRWLLSGWGRR